MDSEEVATTIIMLKAIELWGVESQKMMLVEECSELLNVIAKEFRGRATKEDVIEEIADVLIMVKTMALIYGPDKVNEVYIKKMKRLKLREDEDKESNK